MFTNQLSEKPLFQLRILKAKNVLLCWGTGDGPQPGIALPISRQTDDKHPDVVVFGVCGSSNGAWTAGVIQSIRHQQGETHTAVRRLLSKELCSVRDGVGQICAMTNVGHGWHATLKDVHILPVTEVVFHWDCAAVLQHGQAHTHTPAGNMQRRQPGAETLDKAALLLKQKSFGILRAVHQEDHLHWTNQSFRGKTNQRKRIELWIKKSKYSTVALQPTA